MPAKPKPSPTATTKPPKAVQPPRAVPDRPSFTEPGSVGRTLMECRKDLGITRLELAGRVGIAKDNLGKIELYTNQPRFLTVHALIEAAGMPLERFFSREAILAAAARLMNSEAKKTP